MKISELPILTKFKYKGYSAEKISATKVKVWYPMRPVVLLPISIIDCEV
jgi:hypothetical protein